MTLAAKAYLRAIINPGGNFNQDVALMLLSAGALALRAGFGNDCALTVALVAGSNIAEAAEDALLNLAHLSAAVTIGAPAGLATRFTASTMAQ